MIIVSVFGPTPPCAKCRRAEQEARKAAERFPGEVEVLKLDALGPEAERLGVLMTPTVAVNGEVVGSGKIVPAQELAVHVERILGG